MAGIERGGHLFSAYSKRMSEHTDGTGISTAPFSRMKEKTLLRLQPLKACFNGEGPHLSGSPGSLLPGMKAEDAVTKDRLIKSLPIEFITGSSNVHPGEPDQTGAGSIVGPCRINFSIDVT